MTAKIEQVKAFDMSQPFSIVCLQDVRQRDETDRTIDRIFHDSALKQNFANSAERQSFHWRWLGYYRDCEPSNFFVARTQNGRYAGYLAGSLDTQALLKDPNLFSDLNVFAAYYPDFPAHLHVNVEREAQHHGIGRALVEEFFSRCKQKNIRGLHVITSQEAQNFRFYQKCGFRPIAEKRLQDRTLLMMGIKISA
jgi:GNAT superfamily N-acetyltransferase